VDNKYKNIGSVEDRLIEECSELIQAICKAKRFGYDKSHPDRLESTNLIEIWDEIMDVQNVIEEFRELTQPKGV